MGIEQFFKGIFHDNNDDPATPVTPPPLSATPMTAGRVFLIHGYSANWTGFVPGATPSRPPASTPPPSA